MNGKKIFLAVVIAAIVMVSGLNISRSMNNSTPVSDMALENVEALAQETTSPYCHNGGVGSSSCSISAGITILGSGTSSACNVTCISGYYACCSLTCRCVAI